MIRKSAQRLSEKRSGTARFPSRHRRLSKPYDVSFRFTDLIEHRENVVGRTRLRIG
jgi:hypothetical protein